jgi:hypothetical protein
MFRNTVDKLKGYALGTGANPIYQNIADYGTAAALGVAGQQAMNWVSPGADPNPLIAGALMAPLTAAGLRYGRSQIASSPRASEMLGIDANQRADMFLSPHSRFTFSSPIERKFAEASLAASGAGALSSFYNTTTNTPDIDPNIAGSILAAAVPLTAYLLSKRAKIDPPQIRTIPID